MSEPHIVLNGNTLTVGQAMTVRVALSSFERDISEDGLGDDAHGKKMAALYKERLSEIFAMIASQPTDSQETE